MLLAWFRTFVRVVEAGGITRAAEQLSLTQPAVTKQLRALEEAFGTRLLVRRGRRVLPSASGETLYHYAKRILALVDQAHDAVNELERPGGGEIHLGAVSTVAVSTLPQVLSAFTSRFPRMRVRVRIGEIQDNLDALLRGDVAVSVMTVPIVHPQVDSVPLFEDPVRLVVAPERAARLRRPVRLLDLAEMDFISYERPSRFRSFVDGVLEQHGLIPRVLMEFNSHEVVKTMVKSGLGVAMVPDSVVRDDIAAGDLVAIEVADLPPLARTTSLNLLRDPPVSGALVALVGTFFTHYQVPAHLWPGWYRDRAAVWSAMGPVHTPEGRDRMGPGGFAQ
ncbi:MAG: LysR family transcriptional regulator [Firmicutes bacterium]|nr:LysR family transcriptional regulator [Alicyclobacillaceae bacterium]MCL6497267.1 LysR family transcriptional regulator [Bacillota bacterium]